MVGCYLTGFSITFGIVKDPIIPSHHSWISRYSQVQHRCHQSLSALENVFLCLTININIILYPRVTRRTSVTTLLLLQSAKLPPCGLRKADEWMLLSIRELLVSPKRSRHNNFVDDSFAALLSIGLNITIRRRQKVMWWTTSLLQVIRRFYKC